ncbi:MAG: hypothetical protein M0C28_33050 [Candidatus Moduliflexus flocculans]|nr:hypothetical protein [Candidatus Moduliflexus flocculans]
MTRTTVDRGTVRTKPVSKFFRRNSSRFVDSVSLSAAAVRVYLIRPAISLASSSVLRQTTFLKVSWAIVLVGAADLDPARGR